MNPLTSLLLFTWISYSAAYYEDSEHVNTLTPADLLEIEKEDPYVDNNVWFVQFYASSDDGMEALAKETENTAKATTGYIKWGAVDVVKYPIFYVSKETPPWYQFYGYYKHDPSIFKQKTNTSAQFFETYSKEIHSYFEEKIIFRFSKSIYNFELGGADIETKLDSSTKAWAVLYYDSNCEKCLDLSPMWEKLLLEMREKIHFGSVNNPYYKIVPEEGMVYPTIKFYPAGPKQYPPGKTPYENAITYKGELEYSAMREYFLDIIKDPIVAQITTLRSIAFCLKRNYCIFTFMPKLEHCDASCRVKSLNVITSVAKEYKTKAWIWRWNEYGEQPVIQKYFTIETAETPTFAVLNVRLGSFMVKELKNVVTERDLEELVDAIKKDEGFVNVITSNVIPDIYVIEGWKPGISSKDEL